MSEHDRLRWRCRRGLLELDLVLNGFLESRFENLTPGQRTALARLLDLPDHDLLDMVMGRAETNDPGCAEIVGFLRQVSKVVGADLVTGRSTQLAAGRN